MKIYSINGIQQQNYAKTKMTKSANQTSPAASNLQLSFKGTKGGLWGIVTGAATGAGLAALTIATGGLAGVVAAVGVTSTIVGGAAAGTHIGGIAGSIIEDTLDNKKP